jgi:superfamily II DNA helicase RecQ
MRIRLGDHETFRPALKEIGVEILDVAFPPTLVLAPTAHYPWALRIRVELFLAAVRAAAFLQPLALLVLELVIPE